jgi:TetR/AcrR family transcriptional regulator, transcriptional repressor for nem operon
VRRDQILDAAEQVLLTRGLGAATMADVADAAGIAKGTVYLYFGSKADLLAGMRARHVERFIDALAGALTGSARAKPVTSLNRFIEQFFDYGMAHRRMHHLLFHEAGFSEDDAFAGVRHLLSDFIAKGMADGYFARADVGMLSGFVLSGLHDALVSALHAGDADLRRCVTAAKELTRRLLTPSAAH